MPFLLILAGGVLLLLLVLGGMVLLLKIIIIGQKAFEPADRGESDTYRLEQGKESGRTYR